MSRSRSKNSSQKTSQQGSIRIIAGIWRGRKLPVGQAEGLRPTTDRVKETLFNWLAQDVPQANCLDLFAGSGSLGFEAASRQAKNVVMLELNKQTHLQLTKNIATINTSNIKAINTDTLSFLSEPGTPFDIVFIDPPFRQGLLEECLQRLEKNNWLAKNAMIYIETEKELVLPDIPNNWSLYREKNAGQVSYRLFERNSQ
ncbi:16S rRNA (guanine(966)-N(2))-methyltransferase RsmD [Vibrio sp. TH_r3]|uniref:16S rRNA (guanine(966)-N(2))-methyltransferase RsmD n=1 Tax=Vibrio sp. TH_r3 TaxID=3082084 RepID=UPI0029553E14|nr:16S rRNA (guanine(966)-N(2))-methyltransferase RsmD [Vibrio sp. TH_r3]MDV7106051.1 16S rRNA (guanine(966)-N(2))-methyltransferase RsmD [Vibrio sp. TH_r3]